MMCYDNSEMLSRLIDVMANDKPLMLTSPKQRQGSYFEQQACEFLQERGLILIAQNWQQPKVGELDLVMLEKGQAWSTLVFVEVRQRQHSYFGDAALSVTAGKQRKIIKAARHFLQQNPQYHKYECRFDVIAYNTMNKKNKNEANITLDNQPNQRLEINQPEWLQGAFIASAW
ncbi:YraN family protein [Psychrobacter sp. S4(2024)]|uniref:YraN family protein n=1 Tax=Psychrobacter sp. S4(2024) TaxID=3111913 RepID=UPI002FE3DE9D